MNIIKASSYTGKKSWEAIDIANIEGASIRLHWTEEPYVWHQNDGDELFVVLDGKVNMRYRQNNLEKECILSSGDICYITQGEEHIAIPLDGPARILVIEKIGSI